MGNFRYAIGKPFVTLGEGDFFAPTGTVSSSDKAGYSKANVITEHIAREWRSNSIGTDQYVGVDLGSTRTVVAVLVDGINVQTFEVRVGASSSIPSNSLFRQVTSLAANPRTGRYSTLSIGSTSGRYVGVEINASTARTDGTSEFAVGRIVVVGTLRTMTRNWSSNYKYQSGARSTDVEFPGGNVETQQPSGNWLEFGLEQSFSLGNTNEVADVNRFLAARRDARILHFENRAADTQNVHAYLCKLADDPSAVERFPALEFELELREVI